MRKLKLYIASSLDGFIASENGGLDWLYEVPNPDELDYGYHDLLKSVDTIVMGMNTYSVIVGFGIEWPYTEKTCYVFTSRQDVAPDGNVSFVRTDAALFVEELKKQEGKDIWLLGGGRLNASLLKAGLIDDFMVCVAPAIVGKGVKIFDGFDGEANLSLIRSHVYDTGMVMLEYSRR